MPPAIRVENLSKCYRIHHGDAAAYRTLRDEIMHAAAAPLRLLRGERPAPSEDFWALKAVSFDVQPGEVVGVIGRNGAGKSTLLKILSRITKPTQGRVEMRGRIASLLEVGTGFHPELTGRENIFLSGAILGMKRVDIVRRFDEIVEFADIEKFLDTPVKRYSSGMYVRLGFAIAAHLEPEVLIVDEVLAVGDAAFQRKCLGKMESLASHGRTLIYVSHNLATIKAHCTQAIYLEKAQIRFAGDAIDTVRKYQESTGAIQRSSVELPPNPDLPIQIDRVTSLPTGTADKPAMDILFQYTVRQADISTMLCVEVRNADGVSVYYANDSTNDHLEKRSVGVHQCTMVVPVSFFAPGKYELSFAFWEPGRETIHFPEERVTFERPYVQNRLSAHGIAWPSVLYFDPNWRFESIHR